MTGVEWSGVAAGVEWGGGWTGPIDNKPLIFNLTESDQRRWLVTIVLEKIWMSYHRWAAFGLICHCWDDHHRTTMAISIIISFSLLTNQYFIICDMCVCACYHCQHSSRRANFLNWNACCRMYSCLFSEQREREREPLLSSKNLFWFLSLVSLNTYMYTSYSGIMISAVVFFPNYILLLMAIISTRF